MDNVLIEIMKISNLKMVYCYLIDSKDYNNLDKCLAIEIVYGDKLKMEMNYKNDYFPYFLNKIKEVYSKEKNKNHITFLGDISKKVIENYELPINIDNSYTLKNIYPFNTINYQTSMFIPYVKQALELVLKTIHGDKTILDTNIIGYRNKYVATYTVDSEKHIVSLYLNKLNNKELLFKMGGVDSSGITVTGNIKINDEYVTTKWNIDNRNVSGKVYSDIDNSFIEKEIVYNDVTIYYDRVDSIIDNSTLNEINNILNIITGITFDNYIKTSSNTYLLKKVIKNNNLINNFYCHVTINNEFINISLKSVEGYMEYEDLFVPTVIDEKNYNIVNLNECEKLVQECSNNKYKYQILKDNTLNNLDISEYDNIHDIKTRGDSSEFVRRI